mgnify:CR=1 FL=1
MIVIAAFQALLLGIALARLAAPEVVELGLEAQEAIRDLELAAAAVAGSDLLLVLGSSLAVYPAAFLPEQAGGDIVVVNKGEVGLIPGPGRYFVDADLDGFFAEVAEFLEFSR